MIAASRRIELIYLASLPAIITLILSVVFLAAKHVSGLNHFMPLLPVIPIFYWGLMHARDMPYWFVFLLGLLLDSIMGTPLGSSSLLFMLFLFLLHAQRKYIHKEAFVIKWGYFALLLAVIYIIDWMMLLFFNARPEALSPAFMQWLLTVCCYPFLHKAFDGVYDHISSRRWQILHGL